MAAILITSSKDNVGIVSVPEGIQPGEATIDGLTATEWIPMGHKIALSDIAAGSSIIRYGYSIGIASQDITKGSWVNEKNMSLPAAPDLDSIAYSGPPFWDANPVEGYYFMGYKNADGSTGTRNILGITTSVQCVAGTTDFITEKIRKELLPLYPNVDDVVTLNHDYGCGVAIDAPAAIVPIRTISNLARNPNFGGEIMVIGLGCEKLRPERLIQNKATDSILYLQDEQFNGFGEMVTGIMKTADMHLQKLNQRTRVKCPAAELVVGMQCGGSDAFSGLTGNPVAGFTADLIVRAGGTVFFSEVTEVRDAIDQLVKRAASEEVAMKLKKEMQWYDEYLALGGADRS
ncbi:MAG TPA: UxaA family hydrolase, partial [Chitinophagaceae bacterium]|nr:UxaA family hydrolase [Chitinophagaceae bacterium]